jgi:DNA-binding MurR/RpiR family transcriptional regulator
MNQAKSVVLMDQIREMIPSLSPATKRFAEYVLGNDDLVYKSITMVSEESGAGYGTIVRFCQKIGCSGFQDFKIHLALQKPDIKKEGSENSQSDWLSRAALDSARQLEEMAARVGMEAIHSAAKVLAGSRRIMIIGFAGSYPMALELAYRLSRLGFLATAESDSHMQAIRSSVLSQHDALVAISFSGSTKEILTTMSMAKKSGAKTIALTNYAKSPVAERADLILCTSIRAQVLEEEIASRIPTLFLVERLCSEIYQIAPKAADRFRVTAESVTDRLL